MSIGEALRRILFRLNGRVIRLTAPTPRGNVLISYITLPYLNKSERTLNAHSNRWESMAMAQAFVDRRYNVDLIDISNTTFIPKKKYDFFLDNYHNMERLAPLLGPECKKIFHATTAHWEFNNKAEAKRFDDLYARRGARLSPDRVMPPNRALELCDEVTVLGNDFTANTYAHAGKKITKIPISTTHTFDSPEHKDFDAARKNFIWFGGAGVVHKGLDLVIEAFAQMPEYTLAICGKLDGEIEFKKLYEHELALPNIHMAGFMDPGSESFKKLCDQSIALIYPSCSEGGGGNVILMMHAGLIPIVSYESSVEVDDFGIILSENTIEQIKKDVTSLAFLPIKTLKEKAVHAWQHARQFHTRETFLKSYQSFLDRIDSKFNIR